MEKPQDRSESPSENSENLRAVYEEICRAHDGIADFRAKLLALLPIASGGGIFLLLDKEQPTAMAHLLPVGLFGALVTFGLYLYEREQVSFVRTFELCRYFVG